MAVRITHVHIHFEYVYIVYMYIAQNKYTNILTQETEMYPRLELDRS